MPSTLHLAPATDQVCALREGRITSRELLERQLEHIAKINPALNAVVTLDADGARAAADRADRHLARTGKPLGALHGLAITAKDALETEGMRTTCGTPDLADHIPTTDADAITLLRQAGAIILGKTNTPAFCQDIQTSNPLFGTTANPYGQGRTAGGSSGGPASAVAAGLTSLDVGSDLAGSLRLPAAYCGTYALRPSHGLTSTRGHIPRLPGWLTSSDMVTLGPIARTPADLDLLLGVLAAPAPADAGAWRIELPAPRRSRLRDYRIGIWADDPYCRVDAATRELMRTLTDRIRTAGARVDDTTQPVDMGESDRAFQNLMYATSTATTPDGAFQNEVDQADALAEDDTSPRAFYLRARTQRHRDWLIANEAREKLRQQWAAYFDDHDVLITPAAPTAAVEDQTSLPISQRSITVDGTQRSYYDQTTWANLTSQVKLPAAVIPAGTTPDGLPLSIQIIGPYLADRTVTAAASHLARLLPNPATPPALVESDG
ncbi:amidase [Streptomyces sp. HK10]|uniref:amidase n=1 Tax=Streptomyces sp. HK10 TaxID=3373255 RepID=UPI0037497327